MLPLVHTRILPRYGGIRGSLSDSRKSLTGISPLYSLLEGPATNMNTPTIANSTSSILGATTWTELVSAIEQNSGVAIVPMEILRRLEGAQRLGIHVLKSIESRLGTLGLGHMPDSLPNRQDQEAILYRYGTPASDVISAVRNGLKGANAIRSTYQALHRLNAVPDTSQVVHREVLEDTLSTVASNVLSLLEETSRKSIAADTLKDTDK